MDENAKPLPLGIHFGLPAEIYHQDKGLGSTDIKRLHNDPTSYWFNSRMNPRRPDRKSTPAQESGTAMHKLVYEGEAAFDRLYMRGDDQEDMTTAEKTASTKASNKRAAELGKTCLKASEYDRVAIAAAMITKNPNLATVFTNGFSEVSIIWERDGVRLKARLDYLKQRGIGDLKNVGNEHEVDFREACRKRITNYRLDIQACHYLEARSLVKRFWQEGMFYGDCPAVLQPGSPDNKRLEKIAGSSEFAWQWIFIQSTGAPITWSKTLSPERNDPKTGEVKMGNRILEVSRIHIENALLRYKEFHAKFGESMWLLVEETSELDFDEMPPWFAR